MASIKSATRRIQNPPAMLVASEVVAVGSIVAYDMIASGERKLPDPRAPLSAVVFYAILAVVGSISPGVARVAGAVGAVLALAILVTGKRGAGLIGLLQRLTGQAQTAPAAASPPAAGGQSGSSAGGGGSPGGSLGSRVLHGFEGVWNDLSPIPIP